MSRAIPALAPPRGKLGRFPRWRLRPDRTVYRAHRRGRAPWWFASGTAGRFDLADPLGACYLAATPQAAVRERWGKKLVDQGILTEGEAATTVVSALSVPTAQTLADMRSARAAAFGITREISTIVPYDLPHQWASALAAAGFDGVRYDAPMSTTPTAIAHAVFGNAGEASWAVDPAPVDGAEIAEAAGITVVPIPAPSTVTIIPTPVQ